MTWIQTHTGLAFDTARPRPEDVCLEDVAHALSQLCRYTGHARHFYSVAEHSILVLRIVERLAPTKTTTGVLLGLFRAALFHDATEAYFGDMAAPLKRHPALAGYRELEREAYARAIAPAFGLPLLIPALVKRADLAALAIEAPRVLGEPPRSWELPGWAWDDAERVLDLPLRWLDPEAAREEFLREAHLLGVRS